MTLLHPESSTKHHPLTKLTFVGAHGTGKTTLVNAVNAHLASLGISCSVTPEVPRIICDSAGDPTFFRRDNNTLLKQALLLAGQPIYEMAAAAEGKLFLLCDRAILDHWAYTKCLFRNELKTEGVLASFDNFVVKHCASYDRIFYVPIELSPQDDGVREGDHEFQAAIDEEILRLLKAYGLTYHTVSGAVPERVAQVVRMLNFNF